MLAVISVGCTVLLQNLSGAAHLNGKTGTVLAWVPEKERYRVRLADGSGEVSIKPANLEVSGAGGKVAGYHCAGGAGFADDLADLLGGPPTKAPPQAAPTPVSPKPAPVAPTPAVTKPAVPKPAPEPVVKAQSAPVMNLAVGNTVCLHGLKAKPELNGKRGLVVEYIEAKGRWKVEMDDNAEIVAVKRDNLTVVGGKRVVLEEPEADPSPPAKKQKTEDEIYQNWMAEKNRLAKARVEEMAADEAFEATNKDRLNQTEKMAAKKKAEKDFSKLGRIYVAGFPAEELSERFVKNTFERACHGGQAVNFKILHVKMYRDNEGNLKGDALVTFPNKDMAEQACTVMHGKEVRTGYHLQVSAPEY